MWSRPQRARCPPLSTSPPAGQERCQPPHARGGDATPQPAPSGRELTLAPSHGAGAVPVPRVYRSLGRCLNIFPFRRPGSHLCHFHLCVAEGIFVNEAEVAAASQRDVWSCAHRWCLRDLQCVNSQGERGGGRVRARPQRPLCPIPWSPPRWPPGPLAGSGQGPVCPRCQQHWCLMFTLGLMTPRSRAFLPVCPQPRGGLGKHPLGGTEAPRSLEVPERFSPPLSCSLPPASPVSLGVSVPGISWALGHKAGRRWQSVELETYRSRGGCRSPEEPRLGGPRGLPSKRAFAFQPLGCRTGSSQLSRLL